MFIGCSFQTIDDIKQNMENDLKDIPVSKWRSVFKSRKRNDKCVLLLKEMTMKVIMCIWNNIVLTKF